MKFKLPRISTQFLQLKVDCDAVVEQTKYIRIIIVYEISPRKEMWLIRGDCQLFREGRKNTANCFFSRIKRCFVCFFSV